MYDDEKWISEQFGQWLPALSKRSASACSRSAVNVLFGLLANPAAGYLVGRELFGDVIGLVVAGLFAVSSWAVTFSRFGMFASNTTPLFALLTIGFSARAWRRESMADFAWAGLAGGLDLCFYTVPPFLCRWSPFLRSTPLLEALAPGRWPSACFWYNVDRRCRRAAGRGAAPRLCLQAARHLSGSIENTSLFAGAR